MNKEADEAMDKIYKKMTEEECEAESIGRGGRYGCRCQKCSEGEYTQAEAQEDR